MNDEALKTRIKTSKSLAIFFSAKGCGVCTVLKPAIKQSLSDNFPEFEWLEVALDESPEISGQLQLFSVPTLLVYLDGKEVLCKSRNFSTAEVVNELQRPYQLMSHPSEK